MLKKGLKLAVCRFWSLFNFADVPCDFIPADNEPGRHAISRPLAGGFILC